MREFRANCYPATVKRESSVGERCGAARCDTAGRELNLVKAVIKLISYLEDARMYPADREKRPRSASRSLVFSLTVLIIRDSSPYLRALSVSSAIRPFLSRFYSPVSVPLPAIY